MKKKRLLTMMLVLLAATLTTMAQVTLVIHQTDGTSKSFDITSITKMQVSPQFFSVFTQDESKVALAQIQSIKFSKETTGISSAVDNKDVTLHRNGNMLTIEGLKAGDRVQLFNVNGQMIGSLDGLSLNLSTLGRGVYILKVNNKSFKFAH